MKRHLLLLLVALLPMVASAYNIAVENADGVTIYYNYINNVTELEVTYKTTNYNSYSGSVVIPEEVTFMNRTRKVTSIGYKAFYDCNSLTSITIPESMASIGNSAFSDCSDLTSITIPNSVISIGERAFEQCSKLTSVIIPNSINTINDYTFYGCTSLTSVTIPNSVITIEQYAFSSCGLKKVTIPNSVTSIGSSAFENCTSLTSITIPNSVTSIGERTFQGCSKLTSVIIPNSINTINDYTFYGCTSLTSVTIGNSVTSIEQYAFSSCGLKRCNIPNSVTSIGSSAFENCASLTSVTIGNSVTSIGEYVFRRCSSLTFVTIGNGVTTIERYAFAGCYSLTSITIPNSVTNIGMYAFWNCRRLTSVIIGSSVTDIGDHAFSGCSGLTSVTIPNSVTTIEQSAFSGCSGLTSVTIPNSVTSIGEYAFSGCDIPEVISLIKNPFNIKNNTFTDNTFYNATLYVPTGTIEKYKTTEGWKKFSFIEEKNGGNDVPDIASFLAIDVGDYALLMLTNAQVLYVYNDEIYLRDATGSIILKGTGLNVSKNDVLNGSILGRLTYNNLIPQLIPAGNAFTTISISSGETPLPKEIFGEELTPDLYADMVLVRGLTLVRDNGIFAVIGDHRVRLWNKFQIKSPQISLPSAIAGKFYDVTAIYGTDVINGEVIDELYVLSSPVESVDPDAISAPLANEPESSVLFNVNGQKIAKPQKGINIIRYSDGTTRKVLVK